MLFENNISKFKAKNVQTHNNQKINILTCVTCTLAHDYSKQVTITLTINWTESSVVSILSSN